MLETEDQHRRATVQRQAAFAAWALSGAEKGTVTNYAVLVSRNGSLCIYDAGKFHTKPHNRYAIYDMHSHAVAYVGADGDSIVRVTDPDQVLEQPTTGPTYAIPDKEGKQIMYATRNCHGTGDYITARKGQPFYVCGTTLARKETANGKDYDDIFVPVAAMCPIYPGQAYGLIKLSVLSNTVVSAPKLELDEARPTVQFAPNPAYAWINATPPAKSAYESLQTRYSSNDATHPFLATASANNCHVELNSMAAECWEMARFATPQTAYIGMIEAARLWSMCPGTPPVPNAAQLAYESYMTDGNGWDTGITQFNTEANSTWKMHFTINNKLTQIDLKSLSDTKNLVTPVFKKGGNTIAINHVKTVAVMNRLRHLPANALNPTSAAKIDGLKNQCYTVYAKQRDDGLFEVGAAGDNTVPAYKLNPANNAFIDDANPQCVPWVDGTATNVVRATNGVTLLYGYTPNVIFHDEAVHDHYDTFTYECHTTDVFPSIVTPSSSLFLKGYWAGDTIIRTDQNHIVVTRRSVAPINTVDVVGIDIGPDDNNTCVIVYSRGPHYQKRVTWINGLHHPAFSAIVQFQIARIACADLVTVANKPVRKLLEQQHLSLPELKQVLKYNVHSAYAKTDTKGLYRVGPFTPEVYIEDLGNLPLLSECNVVTAATIAIKIDPAPLNVDDVKDHVKTWNITDDNSDTIEQNHLTYNAQTGVATFNLSTAYPSADLQRRNEWQNDRYSEFNKAVDAHSFPGHTVTVHPPPPCFLPMDRITAINGFTVTTKLEGLGGCSGWVSYTRNGDARLQQKIATSTSLTDTSMYVKDHVYYNAANKPLPPARLYALRKEDTAEEELPVVNEIEEEELNSLVLPAAPVTPTNKTSTVVVFEPCSAKIAEPRSLVLMDWDTGFDANFLRTKFLVGLLPTPGHELTLFCTSTWYAPRAQSSVTNVFSAVAAAAVDAKAHFTIVVATSTVMPFCIMPAALEYTNNNEECYGQLAQGSYTVPAITISRSSTQPVARKTSIPDRSVTGPVLKAVQRAQQRALAAYDSIDEKRKALGASSLLKSAGLGTYPGSSTDVYKHCYLQKTAPTYIEPSADREAKVVLQWVRDYAFAIAMGEQSKNTKCRLVWARAHEQCTFADAQLPLYEWGPAYTTADPTVLQFPSTKVTYPLQAQHLNTISISSAIQRTVTNSSGADNAYRVHKAAVTWKTQTADVLVPLSDHTVEACGLRHNGKMYTWPQLAKTWVACMNKKTHTGQYNGALKTPFIVTVDSPAFTTMGLLLGAVVTTMTDTTCTTYSADLAHVASALHATGGRTTVEIKPGQKLVVNWGPSPNDTDEDFDARQQKANSSFRYIMTPDTSASSPDAIAMLPKGYSWILAVNNLTSFAGLKTTALTFENGAIVTLGKHEGH